MSGNGVRCRICLNPIRPEDGRLTLCPTVDGPNVKRKKLRCECHPECAAAFITAGMTWVIERGGILP